MFILRFFFYVDTRPRVFFLPENISLSQSPPLPFYIFRKNVPIFSNVRLDSDIETDYYVIMLLDWTSFGFPTERHPTYLVCKIVRQPGRVTSKDITREWDGTGPGQEKTVFVRDIKRLVLLKTLSPILSFRRIRMM